MLGISVITEHI